MSLSVEAVAVAKKYTDNSILGIVGVLAGKNCTIKNITKEGIINTVEFEWTADDGTKKTSQMQVSDGVRGEDGIGIESIDKIATLGLVDTYQILYTDGNTQNFLVTNGKDGVQRVRLTTDGNHIYDKDNNILTFVQVKDLVMDSDKFVTLTLDNNISFLPSAYDGSAIWFDAGYIESGVPNQLRVIINYQDKVNLEQIELAKKSVVDGLVSDVEELQDFCKISKSTDNALTQSADGLYVKKSESGEPYDDTEVRDLIATNTADITSLGGRTTNIESDITSIESDISDLDLATQDLETNKVDKVDGKGLSTNDLTNELKEKYDKAEENVQSDWNETDDTSDAYIKNKPNLDDFGKIQSISVDGEKITPDQDKNVDIDLSGKVDKEENKSLVANTDITQITTNKNAIALLNDTDEVDGSVRNIVKRAVEGSMHLSKQFIDHKPTVEEAKENILYLVPIDDEGTCEQYVLAENKVVMIGSTKVDLSNYYNKQEVDNIVDEIQLYKFPNAIIYGEPTINNGQISNFSNANYLILPSVFNLSGRGFEFKFAFTTNTDVTTAQNILGGKYCMALFVQNGKLTLRVSSNGTSWDLVNIEGTETIEANKTYYVKINFTRLNYTLSLSTDDDAYEEIGSVSVGDISPNPSELYIGIGNNFNNPFKGIINLNKCYLKVNQSIVWQGMDDAGLATRLATDLENIDDVGIAKVKEIAETDEIKAKINELELFKFPNATIYGAPTINNGQISGFSASNYLAFPFLVDFGDRNFVIDMAFTTGSDVTNQQNIIDGKFGLALAIKDSKFVLAISTNGESWNLGATEGTYTVLPNTNYYLRLSFDHREYKLSYSLNRESYVDDITVSSSIRPYPVRILIGIGDLDTVNPKPFSGIINMNYCYLTINDTVVWLGMDDVGLSTRLATDLENIDESGVVKVKEIAETDKKVNIQQSVDDAGKALVVGEDGKVVPTEISTDTSEVKKIIADNWNKNGYNLIPYPYYHPSRVNNGVTFTVNDDGTVLVDGTATANAFIDFVEPKTFKVKKGTYKISSGETSEGFLVIWNIDTNKQYNELSGIFTFDEDATCSLYIYVPSGKTISNTLFYPMLVKVNADGSYPTEYQRYALGNVKLTDKLDTKADSSIILKDNLFIADNFTMKNTELIKSVDNGDGTYTINTYLNSEGKFPNNTPFNQKVNANKLDLYDFKGKKLYLRLDVISGDISLNWLGFIVAKYKEDGTSTSIYPYISNKDVGVHQIVSYNVDDIIADGYRYIAFQPWLSNNNVYTDVVMRVVVTTEEWNYNVQDFKYTGYGLNTNLSELEAKVGITVKRYTSSNYSTSVSNYETLEATSKKRIILNAYYDYDANVVVSAYFINNNQLRWKIVSGSVNEGHNVVIDYGEI